MVYGPGKYDDICTMVREETRADCVIVLIINGTKGTGFACQTYDPIVHEVPQLLENMAREIRESLPTVES